MILLHFTPLVELILHFCSTWTMAATGLQEKSYTCLRTRPASNLSSEKVFENLKEICSISSQSRVLAHRPCPKLEMFCPSILQLFHGCSKVLMTNHGVRFLFLFFFFCFSNGLDIHKTSRCNSVFDPLRVNVHRRTNSRANLCTIRTVGGVSLWLARQHMAITQTTALRVSLATRTNSKY